MTKAPRDSRGDYPFVLEEWQLARQRSRDAFTAVPDPSEADIEWFTEEGIDHMATHLVELTIWNDRR